MAFIIANQNSINTYLNSTNGNVIAWQDLYCVAVAVAVAVSLSAHLITCNHYEMIVVVHLSMFYCILMMQIYFWSTSSDDAVNVYRAYRSTLDELASVRFHLEFEFIGCWRIFKWLISPAAILTMKRALFSLKNTNQID